MPGIQAGVRIIIFLSQAVDSQEQEQQQNQSWVTHKMTNNLFGYSF